MGDPMQNGRWAYGTRIVLSSVLVASAAYAKDDAIKLEEIVVTGSRLHTAEPEGPSPVTVFDRQQIESLGATSVSQLLEYLPVQPYNRSANYRSDGGQFAELRGLGADTTLVLINGRRTAPSASSVASNAFDLNTIPLAAVERIEVLSDAASAVYGADAVGGVVNILLRRKVEGTTVDVHYGSAEGGAGEERASLTSGVNAERFHGVIVLDYLHMDGLLGKERDRWNNQDFRRYGGTDQRSIAANPGNVSSLTSANLPGVPAQFAGVPAGSSGIDLSPADFAATAGVYNYESLQRWASIVPAGERKSAAAFGEFDASAYVTLFGEALYADRVVRGEGNPSSVSGAVVPADNPFNPFGVDVRSDFLIAGLGPRTGNTDSELSRGALGARGALGSWDWEVSAVATRETAASWVSNEADPDAVAAALVSTDPASALNVFEDGPGGSAALLSSLYGTPERSTFISEGRQATAFVRGALASLPGGELGVVLGGEWLEQNMHYNNVLLADADRHVSAAFAEVSLPLVGVDQHWPAMRSLSLKLAIRYDDYSDFGVTTNPQYGLTWTPVQGLTLRASYGTSFRAPSLFELYAPQIQVPLVVQDPRRGNQVLPAQLLTGGNPDLDPVEGDSWTAGLVWTPVDRLRISASWWRIHLDQTVSAIPYPLVVAYEDEFPERVVRAAPTLADVAANWPGAILSVDGSRVNYGSLSTSGVDAQASYGVSTSVGDWKAGLGGTWVHDYRGSDRPGAPPIDRVGIANLFGTIPRWRGTASIAWSKLAWSITATGRFVDAYDDAMPLATQSNGHRIAAQSLLDLQIGWDGDLLTVSHGWTDGLKATLGVSNVFDEAPAYAAIGATKGYDTSQGDLRQRFAYLSLSKRFGH